MVLFLLCFFSSPFVRKSLCKSNKFAWINKQKQKIWLCIHLFINTFRTYPELCKFLKLSLNLQLAWLDWLNTTGSSEDFTAKLTNEKCQDSLALMKHEPFSGGFNLFRSNFLPFSLFRILYRWKTPFSCPFCWNFQYKLFEWCRTVQNIYFCALHCIRLMLFCTFSRWFL